MTLLTENKLTFARKILAQTKDIPGDIIEVGVYKGGALWYFAYDSRTWGKKIFGYDTFTGLPELSDKDNKEKHHKGDFSDVSYYAVADHLRAFPVKLVEGYYPTTANHGRVSFCHLDIDLYGPTQASLRYLSNWINPGGFIVLDDYKWPHCPGVEAAVSEVLDLYSVVEENKYQIVLGVK